MSESAFLPLFFFFANRLEKLTYWSQILPSAREIQYPRDISRNHPFHSVPGISEETSESWSRICEHYDGYDTQHWHSENGLFFGFSQGVKLNKSNILYLDSDLNPQEPFSNYLDMRCITNFLQQRLHMSRCWLWPCWNCPKGFIGFHSVEKFNFVGELPFPSEVWTLKSQSINGSVFARLK